MSPERPNTDAGDTNEQVKENFSRTPGLTPVQDCAVFSTEIQALHTKHSLPFLKNPGLKLAGSKHWTSCEERPHTLLLVIELKKLDRLRWREIDADARKLIPDQKLEDRCFLRYYIARKGEYARGGALDQYAEVARGTNESQTTSPPSEREATPSSLPDLISIPSEEIFSATPVSAPLPRQQRRHRRREIVSRAQQSARARHERNNNGTSETPRLHRISISPSPSADFPLR